MELGAILSRERIEASVSAGLWPDRLPIDYLADACAAGGQRLAITTYDGENERVVDITYDDLDRLSRRFALRLADLGVVAGDVVAMQLPNWWHVAALHLACNRIGAITNILMPIFRERELAFMLEFAEAKILVAAERFRGFDYRGIIEPLRPALKHLAHVFYINSPRDDDFDRNFLAEELEAADGAEARLAALRPDPNDVNELAYTSGTTGQPKGVMNTANVTLGHLQQWVAHHDLRSDDVIFMASPIAHRTGFIYGLTMPVMLGCQVVLLDRWHPPHAAELLARHRCTFTMGATPFLNDLVNMPGIENFDLSHLRTFVSAGAPIPPALVQRSLDNFSFKVLSGWGMSECACPSISLPDDPPERLWSTDGKCMPHNECRVVDDDGRELPPGEEGNLKFRGSSLFVGYLKRPDLVDLDEDGWFATGDMARMDAEGYIRISGRAKDIIIRGGENIPVVEVEQVLFRHPAVQDVAVVGAPDERLGERGAAYVVCHPGQGLSFDEMLRYLHESGTAKSYWPEYLVVLDDFPRTPSGKIQKFKLREMAGDLSRD